jgi:hypothetical protein
MVKGLEEAKSALTKVKDEYVMYYNHWCEPAPVFAPGDKVWLDESDIATNRPLSKLSHHRLGPFTVEACDGAYHLALPPQLRWLHPVFPVVSGELPLTYLPYSLSLPFYSLFSILPCHILTGSISIDCDRWYDSGTIATLIIYTQHKPRNAPKASYNADKKAKVSPKISPTTYVGRRMEERKMRRG